MLLLYDYLETSAGLDDLGASTYKQSDGCL